MALFFDGAGSLEWLALDEGFPPGILITPNGVTVTPAVGRNRQLSWEECRLVPNSAGVPELPHGISLEQLDNILPLLEGICARNSRGEAGKI